MTRRRWIADEVHGNRAALIGPHAQHLSQVLRARLGQQFDIGAENSVRRGTIVSISDSRVEFELGEALPAHALPNITLLLAIFKFDRMEWAIEKCTELGVAAIVPVIARRTDAHLAAAAANRSDRWRRLILQASEQSRRSSPPTLSAPVKFRNAIQTDGAPRILLAENEHQLTISEVLASDSLTPSSARSLALAIGPEGGWADDELAAFSAAGWTSASLGPTILRAETAAIAAVAIALSWL